MQQPYAGGGKGRPRLLHPRPRALPLGTPIRRDHMVKVRRACLRGDRSQQQRMHIFGTTEACADGL